MLELNKLKIELDGFHLSADLSIGERQNIAVLGPSGAGKSTLLAAIAGFLPIEHGTIRWQDEVLCGLQPNERPVSMLFQDNNLFPHLNARDNVALGVNPSLKLSPSEWQSVERALERVGLTGLGQRKQAALSGGQVARVALARALIRARPLMLLDEPFGALGPGLKAEMLALVQELARETGATILMVSHDPEDAQAISDQVIWLADGVAHKPIATARIFSAPPPAMAAYLGK